MLKASPKRREETQVCIINCLYPTDALDEGF